MIQLLYELKKYTKEPCVVRVSILTYFIIMTAYFENGDFISLLDLHIIFEHFSTLAFPYMW